MVNALDTKLVEILEGSKQYQVPLYQRVYSWERSQLQRLWTDVTALVEDRADNPDATHFMGSLVLAAGVANGPVGVQRYLVVDGQQRLTALSILLCAVRDRFRIIDNSFAARGVDEQYLINVHKQGTPHKLVPTQADRAAYRACVEATTGAGGPGRVSVAYQYFTEQLASYDGPRLETLEDVVLHGLTLVSITADKGDNVYRIFESLNNTGLKLSQADLLRNYLFMKLPTRSEQVYERVWMPLQNSLSNGELELLFWIDLVRRDPKVKQTDTYARQQTRINGLGGEDEVAADVERLAAQGALLRLILHPAEERDREVSNRLARLQAWGTTTVQPLLMALLDRRANGTASSAEIARVMLSIESYLVRRVLVGRANMGINRILNEVAGEIDRHRPVEDAVRYLAKGRKHFATDSEIRAAVRTVPFYLHGRVAQRGQIMRWIEESYPNKEPVALDTLTIEHVLPQKLTTSWREQLRPDLQENENLPDMHHTLVHTLGNLTLTGYNSTLSNKPFETKKEKLRESGVRMSRWISDQPRWGRAEIMTRADALADQIVTVWPGPPDVGDHQADDPWELLAAAVGAVPAGRWTTYGDLGTLVGSHPKAIGGQLAGPSMSNPHRVLRHDGRVSPDFKWPDPHREDDPQALLVSEGVRFDAAGRAAPEQRMSAEQLARLTGMDDSDTATPDNDTRRETFLDELSVKYGKTTVDAVLRLADQWAELGGSVTWGSTAGASGLFGARALDGSLIRSLIVRSSGEVRVPKAGLRKSPPFDEPALTAEWKRRLNAVPGVNLRAGASYPTFGVSVLDDGRAFAALVDALAWFTDQLKVG